MLSISRQNEFDLAPDSDLKVYQRLFIRRAIQTLAPQFPKILEIGAGSSRDILDFVQYQQYAILDPASTITDPFTTTLSGSLGVDTLSLPNNHFDVICSASVLEHIEHHLWPKAAEQMFQTCKNNGLIIHCIDGKCTGVTGDHFDQMLLWKEFLLNAGFQFVSTPWNINSKTVYANDQVWSMSEAGWKKWWNPPDEEWSQVGKPVSINIIMVKKRYSPRRYLYQFNKKRRDMHISVNPFTEKRVSTMLRNTNDILSLRKYCHQ